MNTTALFVELIVIGAGFGIWLSILVLTVFNYDWVPWKDISSIIVLIPFISIVYALGIILDRIADRSFDHWSRKIFKKYFSSVSEYHTIKNYIYTNANEKIINLFEYSRVRMRISRAWSINNILILISIPLFIWIRFPKLQSNTKTSLLIFSTITFGLFTTASLFSWANLTNSEYKQLIGTYKFLKSENNLNHRNQD
jgi:hypothetical protein